jgi:hypothetical protein
VQKIDQEECVREGMVLGWWERRGQGNEPLWPPFSTSCCHHHPQTASQPEQLETNVQSRQSSKKAKSDHHIIFYMIILR